MRSWLMVAVLAISGLTTGCAVQVQNPVALAPAAIGPTAGKVGIAMTELPKVDTAFPGAGCLLCLGVANLAHSALNAHVSTLSYEDLPELKNQAGQLIAQRGGQPVVLAEAFKFDGLEEFKTDKPNFARRDFRPLRAKHGVDKLLVVEVQALGIWRNYASYVPTEPPKAVFNALAFMVNLQDNSLEWYQPIAIRKAAEVWDQAPKFPELTNAYFQALELGKDAVLKPLQAQ